MRKPRSFSWSSRRLVGAALGLLVSLSTAPAFALSDEIARLVPEDAIALVSVSSLDQLDALAHRFEDAFGRDGSKPFVPSAALLKAIEIPAEQVDRTRPLVIALEVMPFGGGMPLPTFFVPAANPAAWKASIDPSAGAPAPSFVGGYAVLSMQPNSGEGHEAPAITRDLPGAPIAIRLRMNRVVELAEPMLERKMASTGPPLDADSLKAAGVPAAEAESLAIASRKATVTAGLADQTLEWLKSTERLDLSLRSDGDFVAFEYEAAPGHTATVTDPAAERAALAVLGRALSANRPFVGAGCGGMEGWGNLPQSYLTELTDAAEHGDSPEDRAAFQAHLDRQLELARSVKRFVVSGGFGSNGAEFVSVMDVAEPRTYLDALADSTDWKVMRRRGLAISRGADETLEGVKVRSLAMRFDAKAAAKGSDGEPDSAAIAVAAEMDATCKRLFGGDGSMILRLGVVDDHVVSVLQRESDLMRETIQRLRTGSTAFPPALAQRVDAAEGPPSLWVSVDLHALLSPVLRASLDADASAEEKAAVARFERLSAIPLECEVSNLPTRHHGHLRFDLPSLGELARAMEAAQKASSK